MTAGGGTHDTDPVRVKSLGGSLGTNDTDRSLKILPGGGVLRQTGLRPRGAVLHDHNCHSLLIQVFPCGSDLKVLRTVEVVSASGIDNLDRRGLENSGNMPLDIRLALVRLGIRHLSLRPDIL